MNRKFTYLVILGFLLAFTANGQDEVRYKFSGEKIVALINLQSSPTKLDSIFRSFGYSSSKLDSIPVLESKLGWHFLYRSEKELALGNDKKRMKGNLSSYHTFQSENIEIPFTGNVSFGVNSFKKISVITRKGRTVFTIEGHADAKQVYLSGTFNDWSTLSIPMQQTKTGWKVYLNLPPGKYLYKFVVDGRWKEDPLNKMKEKDGNGGVNSVFYVNNHTFSLNGFQEAKRVQVAGSFNGWERIRMRKDSKQNRWYLPLYLKTGTHAYKFVVDGKWIIDPESKVVRDDGTGNKNSVLSIGDTFYFSLKGHPNAKSVDVAGEFNAWNWDELKLKKVDGKWQLPYVLGPGNYSYKFKVDGRYLIDPNNLITEGQGDYVNSVKCISPNTTFVLKGFENAKTVRLSGSFNNWHEQGYTLYREGRVWKIQIYLPAGKHKYKFIVDGRWTIDPDNPLWEKNEYDSKNSILWIKSGTLPN